MDGEGTLARCPLCPCRERVAELEGALTECRFIVDQIAKIPGCGDNSCRFVRPTGMATNGGCRCMAGRSSPIGSYLASLLDAAKRAVAFVRVGPESEGGERG